MARTRLKPVEIGVLSVLVVLAIAGTRSVWGEIIRIGLSSEEQSHILLAPVVAIWLAWLRRGRLRFCRTAPSLWGPIAIGVGWGMSAFGFRAGVDIAWHLGALLVVGGSVVSVVGASFVRQFLPAIVALLFLLPVPGTIRHAVALPLQQITAQVGQGALEILGLPVERMGNVLILNGQSVAVAEACNGMRMVSALALITYAFVFSTPMRLGVRLVILALVPGLAILVNLLRMVPTVLLYGYADLDLARVFHDLSGWASLALALALLWAFLSTLRWLEIPIARVAVSTE
jgi:exosortase